MNAGMTSNYIVIRQANARGITEYLQHKYTVLLCTFDK